MSQIKELLQIDDRTRLEVRRKVGVTDSDIKENIKALRVWLTKTPHLPEERLDDRLENFMMQHKCSVEKTKKALDSYYSTKTLLSEYFDKLVPYSMAFQKVKSYTCVVAMPKLTDDFSRITVHTLTNFDSDLYEPLESFLLMSMLYEIRFAKDYSYKDIVIIDLNGYTLKHVMKFTPGIIKKFRYLVTRTFNYKVVNIHLINVPPYSDKILSIFTSIFPGKVYKKIHMHTSLEHLYEFVPKDFLPSDFGGDQKSLIDLFAKWCDEFEVWTSYLSEQLYLKSDENKRVGRNHEFEIFGTGSQGSFKQLHVQL